MAMKTIVLFIILHKILFGYEYAVITSKNTKVNTISTKQLKDIFMMKKHFLNEINIVPVNLSSSAKIRLFFEKNILHINRNKLNRYWIKQHFQGIRPPTVQSSIQSMKLFVKNVEGAIGYLPASAVDSDLKVLHEF